jgi:hypothetical protein
LFGISKPSLILRQRRECLICMAHQMARFAKRLVRDFPSIPCTMHKIACIGALVASRHAEGWRVDALGAPHLGDRSEPQLIGDFVEKIGRLRPKLITFNGHSFDLPVLRYRAMVNRVAAGSLVSRLCGDLRCRIVGLSRTRRRTSPSSGQGVPVQGTCAHASPRLRVRPGKCRA